MGCSLKNFEQKTPPAATLPEKKVEVNPETKVSDEEVSKEKSKENNLAALIPSSEEQPSKKKAITSDNTDIQNVKISSSEGISATPLQEQSTALENENKDTPQKTTSTQQTTNSEDKNILPSGMFSFNDPNENWNAYLTMDVKPWIEWGTGPQDSSTKEERIQILAQTEWGRKALEQMGYEY